MLLEVQTVMQKRDKYKNPTEENLNGCIIYDLSMRIIHEITHGIIHENPHKELHFKTPFQV